MTTKRSQQNGKSKLEVKKNITATAATTASCENYIATSFYCPTNLHSNDFIFQKFSAHHTVFKITLRERAYGQREREREKGGQTKTQTECCLLCLICAWVYVPWHTMCIHFFSFLLFFPFHVQYFDVCMTSI